MINGRPLTLLFARSLPLAVLVLLLTAHCSLLTVAAQSSTATLSGTVEDENGAVIPSAAITVKNYATSLERHATTNDSGSFTIPLLPPGEYTVLVERQGFTRVQFTNIVLNVGDQKAVQVQLKVGDVASTVEVRADAALLRTDGSVGTVVDRRFVENMPLNGRSLQTLITLAPGTVIMPADGTNQGQLSINGQRTNANYLTVDGVSANIASNPFQGLNQVAGGSVPGFSAVGGTSALVSIDALQEFRVQTSSFAPEFGRTPGGQISVATRSGTNEFRGTAFEYLRNDVFDANNWFANRSGLPKPKERQNDFGGVFGGPILKNRTFFFLSYEGLRLRQPSTQITAVPSLAARQAAAPLVRPYLDVFPLPNGPDLANGAAQLTANFSNSAALDAFSLRLDHSFNPRFTVFGRYNYSPSDLVSRGAVALSSSSIAAIKIHTMTVGSVQAITPSISNELRANYSTTHAQTRFVLDTFGGASPVNPADILPSGFNETDAIFGFFINNPALSWNIGNNIANEQRQINIVDNLQVASGPHQLKFGIDYRRLAPMAGPTPLAINTFFAGLSGQNSTATGIISSMTLTTRQPAHLLSENLAFYGQDTWKVGRRLTLTYGLRWDINPPLRGKSAADQPLTVTTVDDPSTMTIAPRGTPLYETTYGNVAPRVGIAYLLNDRANHETILRGGAGIFYDLGSGNFGNIPVFFPFSTARTLTNTAFPVPPPQYVPPQPSDSLPATTSVFVADPHLKLPRTYQWNVAVEQAFGSHQSMTLTYVAALGRKLLRGDSLFRPNANFNNAVAIARNTGTSDYHALQVQFVRRLAAGLQAQAAWTWAHSIDIISVDTNNITTPPTVGSPLIDRGSSDFDIRHAFNGAISYDIPIKTKSRVVQAIFGSWSVDGLLFARTALPANLFTSTFSTGGTQFSARPNLVPGQPLYLFGPQFPGGKAFNRAAFVAPPVGVQGNLGRNVLRGFGMWQADIGLRRQFRITERIGMQFRADVFNVFNHPNFGNPVRGLTLPFFGESTTTLAGALSFSAFGLNAIHQIGGPRSVQLAIRLQF